MAELYTSRLSHAYGEGVYGEASRPAFERQLARIDGASFARSDVVNGMLDNPMPAGFLGGLNLAAKAVTGRDIDLYIDNLRDERNPTLESASAEIQRELRTRYFNKSWVAEMQTHGYEGARTFMYLTDHLDLWDTTATRTVASDDWREVKQRVRRRFARCGHGRLLRSLQSARAAGAAREPAGSGVARTVGGEHGRQERRSRRGWPAAWRRMASRARPTCAGTRR